MRPLSGPNYAVTAKYHIDELYFEGQINSHRRRQIYRVRKIPTSFRIVAGENKNPKCSSSTKVACLPSGVVDMLSPLCLGYRPGLSECRGGTTVDSRIGKIPLQPRFSHVSFLLRRARSCLDLPAKFIPSTIESEFRKF